MSSFLNFEALFCPRELSDHWLAVVKMGLRLPRIPKPFQFFNYMIQLDNFNVVVQTAWDIQVSGDPLQILAAKLQSVKNTFRLLNKFVGNLHANVTLAREALHTTQQALCSNPGYLNLLSLQRSQSASLWAALWSEENITQQTSCILWLKDEDRNTKFFQSQIKTRWNRNKILSVVNANGVLVSGQSEVKSVTVNYFKDFLGSDSPSDISCLMSLSPSFSKHVSDQEAAYLDSDVTEVEILSTLKYMKKNKSPGPDGFNVNFFIHA